MKKIVITTLIVAVLTLCTVVAVSIFNKKDITVTPIGNNFSVKLYDTSGNELNEIKQPSTVRLKKGTYSYSVTGEGYDAKLIPFTVQGDMELKITPRYLSSYLPTLVEVERPVVQELLATSYPSAKDISITEFTIDPTATWGYGKASVNGNTLDVYRFIVKRSGGSWKSVITPAIAIERDAVKDVPEEIVYNLY